VADPDPVTVVDPCGPGSAILFPVPVHKASDVHFMNKNYEKISTVTFFTTTSCSVIGKTFTEVDWRVEKMSENSEGSVRFCPDSSSGPIRFSLDSEKLEEIGKSWRRVYVDLLPEL
jgi:hypothetical protein